jgi:endo-1,4-beta-xylanase
LTFTRRACLRAAAALPWALASQLKATKSFGPGSAQFVPSLREIAAASGLLFGSDSDISFRDTSPAYERLFLNQCALYAGNLNWRQLAPDPAHENDELDPNLVDPNVAIALTNGLKLTGAHLLWYRSIPVWFETLSAIEAKRAFLLHIRRLAGFYRGRCFSWNVTNEAIEPSEHDPDGLRVSSPLQRVLGPSFLDEAFREARAADPGALLLYNDYYLELDTPEHEARRSSLFRLLDRLQKTQAPIDGIGLQSHLRFATFDAFHETSYRRFLHDIAARGLKIVISELDVDDIGLPSDQTIRDQRVAQIYTRFLAVALDELAVIALVTWGLCDAYSWHNRTQYFPEYIRADHQPQRPLIFDAQLQPKPAFYALLNALEHAPRRPVVGNRIPLAEPGNFSLLDSSRCRPT